MQAKIHPTFYEDTRVHCRACGTTFTTGSTVKEIIVEVCSNCHPYYTGEQKFMDTQGRVEKFQKQQEKARKMQASVSSKKKKMKGASEKKDTKSLKELLGEL